MSIFAGHENKSPEELAKELGIYKSSTIINNSGKKTIQTLDLEKKSSNSNINSTGNNSLKLNFLNKGRRVISKDKIATITEITKESVEINGKSLTLSDFLSNYTILLNADKNKKRRTNNFSVKDLHIGMNICFSCPNDSFKDGYIKNLSNDKITIRFTNRFSYGHEVTYPTARVIGPKNNVFLDVALEINCIKNLTKSLYVKNVNEEEGAITQISANGIITIHDLDNNYIGNFTFDEFQNNWRTYTKKP